MPAEQEREWALRRRQREWLSEGGSAVPVVELLLEMERPGEAATIGRLALRMETSEADRETIETLLAKIESTPPGWSDALAEFAQNPSRDTWDAIIRFSPLERIYDWAERAVRDLMAIGCSGDHIILYASQTGLTPGMIGLVEEGHVSVEALVERGNRTEAARAIWLGLAAQAAYIHGDRFGAIALLRESRSNENDLVTAAASVLWLREMADDEMKEMMRKAGVWEIA